MDEQKNYTDVITQYLNSFQCDAWGALIHHKDQVNKLVYWSGGLLITLLIASRFLGFVNLKTNSAITEMLNHPLTVLILYAIFYSQLAFLLHHHLLIKFYSTILKRVSDLLFEFKLNPEVFKNCRSPYYLQRVVFLHKKYPFPSSIAKKVSLMGSIGVLGYLSLLISLFGFLIKNCIFNTFASSHTIVQAIATVFCYLFFLVLVIRALQVYDKARRSYNVILDAKFDKIQMEIKKELQS